MAQLHKAVDAGDVEVVQTILDNDASQVFERNAHGNTALHLATWQDAPHLVRLLLQFGSDINSQGERGWRPIHFAAYYSCPGSAEILLVNSAKVDVRDHYHLRPLYYAARKRSVESSTILGLLLHYGATLDCQTAICLGMTDIVRMMLGATPEIRDTLP